MQHSSFKIINIFSILLLLVSNVLFLISTFGLKTKSDGTDQDKIEKQKKKMNIAASVFVGVSILTLIVNNGNHINEKRRHAQFIKTISNYEEFDPYPILKDYGLQHIKPNYVSPLISTSKKNISRRRTR